MILRKISQERQFNTDLGKSYQVINQETTPDEFQKVLRVYFPTPDAATEEEIYCFVCTGYNILPLYKSQRAYIMTDSGQTFDNLCFK